MVVEFIYTFMWSIASVASEAVICCSSAHMLPFEHYKTLRKELIKEKNKKIIIFKEIANNIDVSIDFLEHQTLAHVFSTKIKYIVFH